MDAMGIIEKENRKQGGFSNHDMWKAGVYQDIEERARVYPNLSICEDCSEECKEVESRGYTYFKCGKRGIEWRK